MTAISRPFVTKDDPDRDLRCQDALAFAFEDLLDQAVRAGWSARESLEAFIALADERLLSVGANDDTDTLVLMLKGFLNRSG